MKLARASYDWAIKHLVREHDTDLFPLPIEIEAVNALWPELVPEFEKLDVSNYVWRGGRRFIVPKGPLAFRLATQLDPIDNIVLSALLYEFGPLLEDSRLSISTQRVFSYRFAPDSDGRMYAQAQGWHGFWRRSKQIAAQYGGYVVIADISDFYNQIYHHTLERHFDNTPLSSPVKKVLKNYLQTLTNKESRGIPVGPHTSHIFAECALDAIDRSLISHGLMHCRYVDDFHIFTATYQDAVDALYILTQTLDSQQRLVLQNAKTKIMLVDDFTARADEMLLDNPINEEEEAILKVIAEETNDDPYTEVALSALNPDALAKLDQSILEELIQVYLQQNPVDFQRLAWLIRRLTQVGAPGALEILIENMPALSPILGPIARYIMSAVPNYTSRRDFLGAAIVNVLKLPIINRSPYLQTVLMDVVARMPDLNHVDDLTALYRNAVPEVQRGILLVAGSGKRRDWLRDRKTEFRQMEPWCRRAYLAAAAVLTPDEAKFLMDAVRDSLSSLERVVAKHYISGSKVGTIDIAK